MILLTRPQTRVPDPIPAYLGWTTESGAAFSRAAFRKWFTRAAGFHFGYGDDSVDRVVHGQPLSAIKRYPALLAWAETPACFVAPAAWLAPLVCWFAGEFTPFEIANAPPLRLRWARDIRAIRVFGAWLSGMPVMTIAWLFNLQPREVISDLSIAAEQTRADTRFNAWAQKLPREVTAKDALFSDPPLTVAPPHEGRHGR